MSLATSRARLQGALKELRAHRDQAKAKWDDPKSREFEKRYLAPLEQASPRLIRPLKGAER